MFVGNLIAHIISVILLLVWVIGGGVIVRRSIKANKKPDINIQGNSGTKYQDKY